MADLQNEFSWSKSRHEKFQECRRAYYLAYYGSWGGWQAAHGSTVREIYVLKKLSSRWQWAGSLVHDALYQFLADGLPLTRRQADLVFLQLMRESGFRLAPIYWLFVRALGGLVHAASVRPLL